MRVFVNYRTGDEIYAAVLIDEKLCERFGKENVFRDNRAIQLGVDFKPVLWRSLARSDVLVVVIGPGWLDAGVDGPYGARKLDDPDDFVRREIALGLQIGIHVVPVLVGDTPTLKSERLPAALAELAHRQYIRLHNRGAQHDVARLVDEIAALDLSVDGWTRPAPSADRGPRQGAVALLDFLAGDVGSPPDREQLRSLAGLASEAAELARLTGVEFTPRPAGLMMFLPAVTPMYRLAVTFVSALADRLAEHTDLPRLRVAMHEGVLEARQGPDAVDRAARLMSLEQIDDEFRLAGRARLVLALSEGCFEAAQEANADLASYAAVPISERDRCWLHVPGYPVPKAAGSAPQPAADRKTEDRASLPSVSAKSGGFAVGIAHGDVYNGDRVHGNVNHLHQGPGKQP